MAVTEIALLNIKRPQALTDPSQESFTIPHKVRGILDHAASEQATFSGYPVTLLQCQDNPSQLFLIGGWDSVSHHMDDWIPGPINQGLMKSLSEHVDVKWMFHLGVDPAEVTGLIRGAGNAEQKEAWAKTVTAAVGLYVVRDEHKENCESQIQDLGERGCTTNEIRGDILYGWRLDQGFVSESEQGMKDARNTIVVFTAGEGSGDEMRQGWISQMLESAVAEKAVHVVDVVNSK